MICASFNANKAFMFARPCPPQPMRATLTFSLGAANFGPPSTWRGTTVNAAAATDAAATADQHVAASVEAVRKLISRTSGDILVFEPDYASIGNVIEDYDLLRLARNEAFDWIAKDPALAGPASEPIRRALVKRFKDTMRLIEVG